MSTPDPTTVCEIARRAVYEAIVGGKHVAVNGAIIANGVPGPVTDGTFEAYRTAVGAEYDRLAAALSWPDKQPQDEREFAWHELRRFSGPALLDEGDVDQHEITHPEQCHTLPPGAACWAEHQPFRWWWPTAHGTYRIRPEDVQTGGSEDGPDWNVTLRVQVRDEAGEWIEYDGDTAGPDPDDDYPKILERVKAIAAEKAAANAKERAERDAQLADLATELDAANDDADEIAEQRTAYREEIMRLRARVRELETANGERVSAMPTCCNALPAGWIHGANCAALDARNAKAGK